MDKTTKNSTGSLLTLLAFTLLITSLLLVLLSGADVVNRITERDRNGYDRRTAVQYMTTRIRHSDSDGALSVGTYNDSTALIITEEIDGETFQTFIYYYDGYICELFCRAGYTPAPEFGEKVLPADAMQISDADDYIEIRIETNGSEETLRCMIRSRKEGER